MGGFFGAVSHQDVTLDIFFGVDYHSHLGTRRGGMIIHDAKDGFQRQIHSIENTPFRTKFEKDLSDFHGCSGIGCISDTDPQPLLVRSHLGLYAITTVSPSSPLPTTSWTTTTPTSWAPVRSSASPLTASRPSPPPARR